MGKKNSEEYRTAKTQGNKVASVKSHGKPHTR